MMNRIVLACVVFCASALAAMPAIADAGAARVMEITEPAWVRATPPNRDITAGYVAIRNTGSETRHIVAAASPAAGRVELHTHIHDRESGMMQMREVESIELPAGETVQLAPGGLHLMLMNLKQDLQPGASVSLTLEFDDGSHLELQAEVHREAPGGHQGHGHGHHRH